MNTSKYVRLGASSLVAFSLVNSATAAPVAFQNGAATFSQSFDRPYSPNECIDGILTGSNGWAIFSPASGTNAATAVWETVTDLTAGSLSLQMLFNHGTQHLLGRFRFSTTTDDRSTFADGLANGGDVTANWTVLTPTLVTATAGMTSSILGDGSVLMGGTVPGVGQYTVDFNQALTGITGIRLEAMADASLPTDGPGLQPSNGNFVVTELIGTSNPVPEPATMTILGLGLVAAVRRRRANR